MHRPVLFVWAILFTVGASGQTSAPLVVGSLPEHLEAARYGLRIDDGVLSGAGARVLGEAIANSHYILIGEDHLTREVPQFTSAVCREAAKSGLAGLALETSPEVAEFAMKRLASPDRWEQMIEQTKAYPFSIAFLNSRQEYDMVADCAHVSRNAGFHLWGLDYNFLGSSGWLIDRMLDAHPGLQAKAALLKLKSEDQSDAVVAKAGSNVGALFLLSAKTEVEMNEAQASIDHDGGVEVRRVFGELKTSYQIYRTAMNTSVSDGMRATLLKRNFRDAMGQISANEKTGKVIVKFGLNHLYKGVNPVHDLNLGDYIAETAELDGQPSLHIAILGATGKQSAFVKYGAPTETREIETTTEPLLRWTEPFVAKQVSGQWTVYDLRALRYSALGRLDSELRRVLDGYDLLVIVPEFTPAEMAD